MERPSCRRFNSLTKIGSQRAKKEVSCNSNPTSCGNRPTCSGKTRTEIPKSSGGIARETGLHFIRNASSFRTDMTST